MVIRRCLAHAICHKLRDSEDRGGEKGSQQMTEQDTVLAVTYGGFKE